VNLHGLAIGQVARHAGVGVQTVRYYERRGLLRAPARRPSGQRVYEPDTVDLLRTVKKAQHVGFTLAEIEDLLHPSPGRARGEVLREQLRHKITHIDGQIGDLLQMRAALLTVLHAGCDALVRCSDQAGTQGPATPGRALHGALERAER
jgi:DNA-binding transcriptional MerR regulator